MSDGEAPRSGRAGDFVRYVTGSADYPFATIVAIEQDGTVDAVVIDVEPELPQRRVVDIRDREPIRLEFAVDDGGPPHAYALRDDFPLDLVHTNHGAGDGRRWLCLWEESWAEARTRLDPETLLQRLRTWLTRSAAGENHADGQPLEPLLPVTSNTLVVPADMEALGRPLSVTGVSDQGLGMVVRLGEGVRGQGCLNVFAIDAPPTVQRAFMRMPRTIADLDEFATSLGVGFLQPFRQWLRDGDRDLSQCVLLLLRVPLCASAGEPARQMELRAFSTRLNAGSTGVAMGVLLDAADGSDPVMSLSPTDGAPAAVAIDPWRVVHRLDRAAARCLSGTTATGERHVLAVGAGAVGSNVIDIASRSGLATWTIVDDDVVLPHNTVRQAQGDRQVGTGKAASLAELVNGRLAEPGAATPLVTNVLEPGERQAELLDAVSKADLVLDLTASPAALRALSSLHGARRVASLFFGPDGGDLVFLSEPEGREVAIEEIESQYFWACATLPELAGHLDGGRIDFVRYSNACQDLTRPLPPWNVVALSAIGARELDLLLMGRTCPSSTVWRLDQATGSVSRVDLPVSKMHRVELTNWSIAVSQSARAEIEAERAAALPVETGGVLLGTVDLERRIVHVTGSVSAPRDSDHSPTFFVRGSEGLRRYVDQLRSRSAGILGYLGEWHSHPDGVATRPSLDDETLFRHLAKMLGPVARPYVMAISGDAGLWIRLGCAGEVAGEMLWPACSGRGTEG